MPIKVWGYFHDIYLKDIKYYHNYTNILMFSLQSLNNIISEIFSQDLKPLYILKMFLMLRPFEALMFL